MGFCPLFDRIATLASGADVKNKLATILSFPGTSTSASRSELRGHFLNALRVSESPVVIDFSGCNTLNHDDIDLLIECAARVSGRDREVRFAAGSRVIRVLLEVTRISSIVPVFDSVEEALAIVQVPRMDFDDAGQSPDSGEYL
jgi:anti-anti-sigma regulatory factor